jgi:tetratricopeptide (TPR) repeat protein
VTRVWTLIALVALTAGCVTPYREGERALSQGRYNQAATYFSQALAEDPGRSDALLGLGMAQYKQGQFPDATETLSRAVAERPIDPTSRLYLALSYLQQDDLTRAEEQLKTLRDLKIDSRLGRQVGRALDLLQEGPLSEPLRGFVAGSLETEAELAREAQQARLEADRVFYYAPAPYPCVLVRRAGRLFCI